MKKTESADARHSVPVIDLFAGAGGLGEGFSALDNGRHRPFDVRLSIEKDPVACATLLLRKLVRGFPEVPELLQKYMQGTVELKEIEAAYGAESAAASQAVWNAELGKGDAAPLTKAIRSRIGRATNWVLLGGPPCQAYSIAGRARMRTTRPDFEQDERHFLYREYLRIVAMHRPAVFVLENVKGLITSRHGGDRIVTRILDDLTQPSKALGIKGAAVSSYRLYALGQRQASLPWEGSDPQDGEDFILHAEDFGIPQQRHRLFIVGVRSDVPGRPDTLERSDPVPAGNVLSDLPRIRSRLSRETDSLDAWRAAVAGILQEEWMTGDADRTVIALRKEVRAAVAELKRTELSPGATFLRHTSSPPALGKWFRQNATGVTDHDSRSHMRSDLHRYLFAAAFARVHGKPPELKNFPRELRPAHQNLEREPGTGDIFADRFRVQLANRPSTTITSHISKDGHYYIHYDPVQCRSLTVREAARLQTFPDDFYFEGNRTQKYHQIGNAVPPLLAMKIANVIYELMARAGLAESGAATKASILSRRSDRVATSVGR